jgi:hypothetical protein
VGVARRWVSERRRPERRMSKWRRMSKRHARRWKARIPRRWHGAWGHVTGGRRSKARWRPISKRKGSPRRHLVPWRRPISWWTKPWSRTMPGWWVLPGRRSTWTSVRNHRPLSRIWSRSSSRLCCWCWFYPCRLFSCPVVVVCPTLVILASLPWVVWVSNFLLGISCRRLHP